MTTSHEFITHLFLETNVKKLKSVLTIVTAAATLTFGLASAQASPDTVAIKDLKLVGEKTAEKTNEHGFNHGGGHGYYGGHRGGHGYYGGHHGGHWKSPSNAAISPKVSL